MDIVGPTCQRLHYHRGELKFQTTPDYESPTTFTSDQGTEVRVSNNIYTLTVSAGDGSTTAATVDVTVNVQNEEEDGTIQVDTFRPKAGTLITATLVDDDNPVAADKLGSGQLPPSLPEALGML